MNALVATVAFGSSHANYAWRFSSDPGVCTLQQDVPTGGTLEVSKPIGRDGATISFKNGDSDDESSIEVHDATVSLSQSHSFAADGHFRTRSRGRTPNWMGFDVHDPQFLGDFANAQSLTLAASSFGQIAIPVRAADDAVQALVSCEQARLREWGIDPAAWKGLRTRATPIGWPASWLSSDYYPFAALNLGVGASVVALLTVGADGTVRDCKGLNQKVPEDFNDKTCDALKRHARFHPAIDASGHPTSAPYILVIKYQIGR